jgi:hypothetical protein
VFTTADEHCSPPVTEIEDSSDDEWDGEGKGEGRGRRICQWGGREKGE